MILSSQANLWTTPVARSPEEVISLAKSLTRYLSQQHPLMKQWYALPSSRSEKAIPLEDSDALFSRISGKIEQDRRKFGDYPELGASLSLANVDNDRDWCKPGVAVLELDPTTGFNCFSLEGIEPFGASTSSLMLNALIRMVAAIEPTFASTDVNARTPEKGLVTYQLDRRLYQHRRYFGWMGFVPAQITHAQIPDAHAVHAIDGQGTVIVSVPGMFDPTDDAQVDKVHRVEMDLASYDLLPVTDPSLKG
ncbi:TPA: immunity 52 family protein [Stenotrophomonas maltophilia]|nr:immunity 52 family protein [Stenotrophomonas maltophilia]